MSNRQNIAELETVVTNSSAPLSERISAVHELGCQKAGLPFLRGQLGKTTNSTEVVLNWDPAAAQRVMDLHAIEALYRLGDGSELGRIPALVFAAGRILQGPDDERRHAASVIAAIGSAAIIGDLVSALANPGPTAANVFEVLDTLGLPKAPVRQNLDAIRGADADVSGVSTLLGDLLKQVVSAGSGWIRNSSGVDEMILSSAGPIGKTELKKAKVSFLLRHLLPNLNLDYYVENARVVICTFPESAERWRIWWASYGARLAYSPDRATFFLA